MAVKEVIKNSNPIYEPAVLPKSQLPAGFPNSEMVRMYVKVGINARIIKNKAPKYFPRTICRNDKGFVSKSSKVPVFISSLKLRMVTAEIKKISTHGAN